jgi:hypothetical protein
MKVIVPYVCLASMAPSAASALRAIRGLPARVVVMGIIPTLANANPVAPSPLNALHALATRIARLAFMVLQGVIVPLARMASISTVAVSSVPMGTIWMEVICVRPAM